MPAIRRRHLLAPLASLFALGACEHGAISETTVPADDGPALILDGSMENLGRVKHMLASSVCPFTGERKVHSDKHSNPRRRRADGHSVRPGAARRIKI